MKISNNVLLKILVYSERASSKFERMQVPCQLKNLHEIRKTLELLKIVRISDDFNKTMGYLVFTCKDKLTKC